MTLTDSCVLSTSRNAIPSHDEDGWGISSLVTSTTPSLGCIHYNADSDQLVPLESSLYTTIPSRIPASDVQTQSCPILEWPSLSCHPYPPGAARGEEKLQDRDLSRSSWLWMMVLSYSSDEPSRSAATRLIIKVKASSALGRYESHLMVVVSLC